MTDPLQLLAAYATDLSKPEALCTLAKFDDYVCACDGHVLLRRRGDTPGLSEPSYYPTAASWTWPLHLFDLDAHMIRQWAGDIVPGCVPCDDCIGEGCPSCEFDKTVRIEPRWGWLAPGRAVDRNYVALIMRMAGVEDVIRVSAQGPGESDHLRFEAAGDPSWSAVLMPGRIDANEDAALPLWLGAQTRSSCFAQVRP